jgi:hypothetical protein
MERIQRPLLFEIIGYDNRLFFALESVSMIIQHKLADDASYLHTIVEDAYPHLFPRTWNLAQTKSELRLALTSFNRYIYNFADHTNTFAVYDIWTGAVKQHEIQQ